jgi:predicted lipoprotein with Yx(FWY)xxD motif
MGSFISYYSPMPASIPPDTPADISLFFEDGKYIFRVGESRSIYVYDLDKAGKPTCSEECSRHWLPVIASKGSQPVGAWTMVERTDHSKQWCYRNQPIYTYVNDKSGATSGDGVDGVWHVVLP